MSINIRFDYYHLKADKARQRKVKNGQNYFGKIDLDDFILKLKEYFDLHKDKFDKNGLLIKEFNNQNKWIKWVSIENNDNYCKLLFTFNDKQVDPRVLESREKDVLAQEIPDTHGLRTLLHIVIKKNVINRRYSNLCIQTVSGLSGNYTKSLFCELFSMIYDDSFWLEKDPVTEKNVKCKPEVEIDPVTTSSIIDAVNKGLLNSMQLVEQSEVDSGFDENNVLKDVTKTLGIKVDDKRSFFEKISPAAFKNWIDSIKSKSQNQFDGDPNVYLIIKSPQNKGEIKYPYTDDVTTGLIKRAYLNWEDRNTETTKALIKKDPTAINQCYDKMIDNF